MGEKKRNELRRFLDTEYKGPDYFNVLRLILPDIDKERNNYGLKESGLGNLIAEALKLSKDSADAQKLINWRKGGTSAGTNAGNFANIAAEVLYLRQPVASKGLTIRDVNEILDRLAGADKRQGEQVAVLTDMISKTNAHEMRWIIMIILKELKLGISDKTVFGVFHPDADHLYGVTCDLRLICERLSDRKERISRQDIEVGKAIKPQLAARVANVETAWKKLRGKQVVVECKLDGDRIQVHKDGEHVYFYARSAIDHQVFKEGMADVLVQNIIPDKCILDGEMLVWDHSENRFESFGSNRGAAKAAKDGQETNQKLFYVAFDILYQGGTSLIHLPLRERQDLLSKAMRPVKRRFEFLHPNIGHNCQQSPDEPKWSIVANSAEEVHQFFVQTIGQREEGIVLKDLDSNWEPDDRSGKWLKFKPDYVSTGSDHDVLIIGGYFGAGRRGGKVAQFLLGIAEKPNACEYPTRFLSFCKVGTGLTDEESNHLVQKLKPYFRRNEKNSRPPICYTVTNHGKERPDVWVDQPDKSVILQISSDIRTITTDVFAAPYGLRFPRVARVRYDKPWYDCLDLQELQEIVNSKGGSGVDLKGCGKLEKRPKRPKTRADLRSLPLVPSHMLVTDVSHVQRTSQIFSDLAFYFVNSPDEYSREHLHKLVAENGGSFSMNLSDEVTHVIASDKKGIKYQAAAAHGDVIHYSWIIDCCTAKTLLPVRPKYFLHLSNQTKEKMAADIDTYGDYYYADTDSDDLAQLLKNVDSGKLATDFDELSHYKRNNPDSQKVAEITLKRQELEVGMHGGAVCGTLDGTLTHMIVFTSLEQSLPFKTIHKSIAHQDRKFIESNKLKVLSHHWIDDHLLGTSDHPLEEKYNLRDPVFQFNEREMSLSSTSEADDSQVIGNANDYQKGAHGGEKRRSSSAKFSELSPQLPGAREQANHQESMQTMGEVKIKTEGLADPRQKRTPKYHSGQLPDSPEVTRRPLKRLVTVEKPTKRNKRTKADVKRNPGNLEKSAGGQVTGSISDSKRSVKLEEPSDIVLAQIHPSSPEEKVAITKIEGRGNSNSNTEVAASSSSGEDHLGAQDHGQATTTPCHQGTGAEVFDALMGDIFPALTRSQYRTSSSQEAKAPVQEEAAMDLPRLQAGDDEGFKSTNFKASHSGGPKTSSPRSCSVPKESDNAPTTSQRLPTTKRKVSLKNRVRDLIHEP